MHDKKCTHHGWKLCWSARRPRFGNDIRHDKALRFPPLPVVGVRTPKKGVPRLLPLPAPDRPVVGVRTPKIKLSLEPMISPSASHRVSLALIELAPFLKSDKERDQEHLFTLKWAGNLGISLFTVSSHHNGHPSHICVALMLHRKMPWTSILYPLTEGFTELPADGFTWLLCENSHVPWKSKNH